MEKQKDLFTIMKGIAYMEADLLSGDIPFKSDKLAMAFGCHPVKVLDSIISKVTYAVMA